MAGRGHVEPVLEEKLALRLTLLIEHRLADIQESYEPLRHALSAARRAHQRWH
jgi:hypothetical protein